MPKVSAPGGYDFFRDRCALLLRGKRNLRVSRDGRRYINNKYLSNKKEFDLILSCVLHNINIFFRNQKSIQSLQFKVCEEFYSMGRLFIAHLFRIAEKAALEVHH
jgi:hypothetical protein